MQIRYKLQINYLHLNHGKSKRYIFRRCYQLFETEKNKRLRYVFCRIFMNGQKIERYLNEIGKQILASDGEPLTVAQIIQPYANELKN